LDYSGHPHTSGCFKLNIIELTAQLYCLLLTTPTISPQSSIGMYFRSNCRTGFKFAKANLNTL